MKYINYNRKSTDSEDKQILSIVAQEEAAQELAIRLDFPILEKINESKSAKIANKRPGFDRMVSAIKRGKYNAIVCWKLDRLARNMVEGGIIIELLQQGKIQEIRTPGRVYTSSENSILLAVEFGSANQYSRDLSVNVKRGQKKKAQMGIPHGLAIYGFSNNSYAEKGTRSWKVNENELNIMRAIFKKMLEGTSTGKAVYRWAMRKYHLTTIKRKRVGGRPMAVSHFYTILGNPIYAGFFEYNNIRYELDLELPRIITEEQYYRIQKMLSRLGRIIQTRHQSPYTGFIKSPEGEFIGADFKFQLICDCRRKFSYVKRSNCPYCDKPIEQIKHPKYLSYTYHYNVVRKRRRESTKVIRESDIDRKLYEDLEEIQVSETFKHWIISQLSDIRDQNQQKTVLATKQKEIARADLERKRKRLRDLLVDEILNEEEYRAGIDEIEKSLMALTQVENVNEKQLKDMVFLAVSIAEVFLPEIADKPNTYERKRSAISKLCSNLTWDEQNLCISWPKWVYILKKGFQDAKRINPTFEPKNILADKDETGVFDSVRPTLCLMLDLVRTHLNSM